MDAYVEHVHRAFMSSRQTIYEFASNTLDTDFFDLHLSKVKALLPDPQLVLPSSSPP